MEDKIYPHVEQATVGMTKVLGGTLMEVIVTEKKCKTCGIEKSPSGFSERRKVCKKCRSETNNQYNKDNRDALSVKQRLWMKNNREKTREYDRKRYPKHRARVKTFLTLHPEKIREYANNRRGRQLGAGTFSSMEWTSLCDKYGKKCLCCGRLDVLTVDHVIPLSKGGENRISNIQPLCRSCNSKKNNKTIDYRGINA